MAAFNPSRPFIERPVATTLLMLAVVLCGFLGYRLLPVSALPEVDYPTIQVVTLYPGASPEVTTASITAPLERQLGQMPGLTQMTSTSSGGASIITLQFNLDVSLDVAEQEVQAALNAAGNLLPADLPNPPVYNKVNPADEPIISIAISSPSIPLTRLQNLADTRLAGKIAQVSGVGLVTLSGGQRPAVRVQANPQALAQMGLTLADIRSAVAAANVNSAKGSFNGPLQSSTIDANDQLQSIDDYKNLILRAANGSVVRLGDVAQVVEAAENTHQGAWANGKEAIILNVQRQPGANVIAVTDTIKKILPQLKSTLPPSVDVAVLGDRTQTIRASVEDVQFEMMLAIALVVMVVFLFLRNVSATIIPAVAVPLSLVGAFGVMYLAGFSLDNLSLMALTIATGFVVDDAIVMIENIERYLEMGETPFQAALKGSRQIGFTIISLTVSLIAVLIPLLFMGDVIGRLFREFAITLAVSILISAFVSLTLTPMMCARLLKHIPEAKQGRFYHASGRFFERITEGYARMLSWVLRHQGATLLVALATLALTVLLYVFIPKGFFPQQDTGALEVMTQAPQQVSYQAMSGMQQALAARIADDPAIESIASFVGVDGRNPTLNSARLQITLKPKSERADIDTVIKRLQDKVKDMPQLPDIFIRPVQDLTIDTAVSRSQYQFTLQSPNPAQLSEWVPKLTAALQQLPQLKDVTSDLQDQGLQAYVNVDRDSASRLGVNMAAVNNALYDAFGQRLISTIFTQTNQYKVVLEVDPQAQAGIPSLANIYVPTASGTPVPLSSFASIEERKTSLSVNHLAQFPVSTVSFNVAPGVSLGEAVDLVRQEEAKLGLPTDIQTQFQGAALAFKASLANTLWLVLAAIVAVYIVLGVLYESYIHPITILSTLPSAGIGALLALMLTGNDLNIIAIIGIILLIGIVKKNAIMMIDFALEAEREQGMSPEKAIFAACRLRLRPILMTTMAALFAALPLVFGSGMGSELRQPLGITMIGGLLLSQVLTLFTTPVIYLWFDRTGQRLRRRFRRRHPEQPALGVEP